MLDVRGNLQKAIHIKVLRIIAKWTLFEITQPTEDFLALPGQIKLLNKFDHSSGSNI